jgi:hypothetical protein
MYSPFDATPQPEDGTPPIEQRSPAELYDGSLRPACWTKAASAS